MSRTSRREDLVLRADPELFGGSEAAGVVLAAVLDGFHPEIGLCQVDLVSDADDSLPESAARSRQVLEGLRKPRKRPWNGGLHPLPAVDLEIDAHRVAVAGFAYWSINCQIWMADYSELFQVADTGCWATYTLPARHLGRFRASYPTAIPWPDDWPDVQ